jgi:hypothetical protein
MEKEDKTELILHLNIVISIEDLPHSMDGW